MSDMVERAAALGSLIRGYEPERVAAAIERYLEGASANAAARASKVPEQRLRQWIAAIGVKRSAAEVDARRREARQLGLAVLTAQRREAARLRRAAIAAIAATTADRLD